MTILIYSLNKTAYQHIQNAKITSYLKNISSVFFIGFPFTSDLDSIALFE